MPSIEDYYRALPPVTRFLLTAYLLTGIIAKLAPQILLDWILLSWPKVIYDFQIYRMFTGFLFIGTLGFPLLMSLYLVGSYLRSYEATYYSGDNGLASLCFEIAFAVVGLLIYTFIFDSKGITLPGHGLMMFLIYLWSRKDPMSEFQFYSFKFKQWHFPLVLIVFQYAVHNHFQLMDIVGILLGHLYHCLTTVYPDLYRRDFIKIPNWWFSSFNKYIVNRANSQTQQNAADWRGRPTWQQGQGHRAG